MAEFAVSPTDSPIRTPLERNINSILDFLGSDSPATSSDTPKSLIDFEPILKDVTVYVEVRSENENRSKAVQRMLQQMGATIAEKFTPEVTHVVFKDGKKSTLDKAKKKGIFLVSVLWVDSCKRNKARVLEDLYPVHESNENKRTPILIGRGMKKNKSMQPKDFDEEVASSTERMEKKIKRRAMADKWKVVETPYLSPRTTAHVYVEETQPRSPDEDSQYYSPSMTIPDTPPSMREKMNSMRQQILHQAQDEEDGVSKKLTPLQRRLFGAAAIKSPGYSPKADRIEDNVPAVIPIPCTLSTPNMCIDESKSAPPSVMVSTNSTEMIPVSRLVASGPQPSRKPSPTGKADNKKNTTLNKKSLSKRKLLSVSDSLLPSSQLVEPTKASNTKQEKESILDIQKPKNPRVKKLADKKEIGNKTKGRARNTRRQSELPTSLSLTPEVSAENKKVRSLRRRSVAVSSPSVKMLASTEDSDSDNNVKEASSSVTEETVNKPKARGRRSMYSSTPPIAEEVEDGSALNKIPDHSSADVNQSKPTSKYNRRKSEMPPKPSSSMLSLHNNKKSVSDSCSSLQKNQSKKRKSDDKDETCSSAGNAIKKFKISSGKTETECKNSKGISEMYQRSANAQSDTGRRLSRRRSVAVMRLSENRCPADFDSTGDESTIIENPAFSFKKTTQRRSSGNQPPSSDPGLGDKYTSNKITKPKKTKPALDQNVDRTSEESTSETDSGVKNTSNTNDKLNLAKNRHFHIPQPHAPSSDMPVKHKLSVSYSTRPSDSSDQTSGTGKRTRHRSQKGKQYLDVASYEYTDSTSDSDSSVKEGQRQSEKVKSSKPRKPVPPKPKVNIVMTSLHSDEQDIVISVIRKLGGFRISETVNDTTTHVVCGETRRTLNVLFAITHGLWLVSKEWVLKSLEAGKWVEEEPYELNETFPAAQVSRLERVTTQGKFRLELLAGKGVFYISEESKPPYRQLTLLVKQCGGQVTQVLRKADVCIGKIDEPEIITVSEQWMLDSITYYESLPYDKYILFTPHRRVREPSPDY